jgi:hypothetical protein
MTIRAVESRGVVETGGRVRLEDPLPVKDDTVVRVIVLLQDVGEDKHGATRLSPLPELEGYVPAGWRDAVYE